MSKTPLTDQQYSDLLSMLESICVLTDHNDSVAMLMHGAFKAQKNIDAVYDNKHFRLLHGAIESGREGLVKAIIDCKADLNARTDDGFTPLLLAVARWQNPAIRMLIAAGARLDDRCYIPSGTEINAHQPPPGTTPPWYEGLSAIAFAVAKDNVGSFEILRDAGASLDMPKAKGNLLHLAACNNAKFIIVPLLELKLDIEQRNANGQTPLDTINHGGTFTIEALLAAGARIHPERFTEAAKLHHAGAKYALSAYEARLGHTTQLLLNRFDPALLSHNDVICAANCGLLPDLLHPARWVGYEPKLDNIVQHLNIGTQRELLCESSALRQRYASPLPVVSDWQTQGMQSIKHMAVA